MASMSPGYEAVLETCEPYLVASPLGAAAEPRPGPPGVRLGALNRLDPHRVANAPFLTLLQRLDEKNYGPADMALPRWAFYDCGEVPGGLFGFARPVEQVPQSLRDAIGIEPGYRGLVPLSMLLAIPMLRPGEWHVYGLCAVDEAAAEALQGPLLLQLTLAVGLTVLGVQRAYGAAQWGSSELAAHGRFAPLELLTAWTPAHSHPDTLTWRFEISPKRVAAALANGPDSAGDQRDTGWVDGDDETALKALQARLEAGQRFQITGPPRRGGMGEVEGAPARVPLREVEE